MKFVTLFNFLPTILLIINIIPDGYAQLHLRSVSVMFRHGDRTPKKTEIYPNYAHRSYIESLGYETLTDIGKQRHFLFGKSLQERYKSLLPDDKFTPDGIHAISTDYSRTINSMDSLLAGLLPIFNKKHNREISSHPVSIKISKNDKPNFWNSDWCPRFSKELEKVTNTTDYKIVDESFQKLAKHVQRLTGHEKMGTYDLYKLFHLFVAEEAMNLRLPSWAKSIYNDLRNVALFIYKTYSYNDLQKKLNGGLFLEKVLQDLQLNEMVPASKHSSINLYSAHGSNIAAILQTLNVWNYEVPKFGSAVIIELYEKNHKYYVKILYNTGDPLEYKTLTVPQCELLCPLEKLQKLIDVDLNVELEENCKLEEKTSQ